MRLAILSAGDGWHVRDLKRAASELGYEATAIDFRRIATRVDGQTNSLTGFDRVLVRTMPPGSLEQVVFRMDVLNRLETKGVPVINPPRALETCVDKFLASALLEADGIPVPPTIVCQHADAALEAFTELGGDVVIKPLFGSEGRGMIRVSDADLAWRAFRTLERLQTVIYVQKFIAHAGWDLRVFVLAQRVLAAIRRHGNGRWRTNVAQGGQVEVVHLSPEEEELALRAASCLGTLVAGIDLVQGPAGEWYVLEVNAVPGWRALAPATGIDVAREIISFSTRGVQGD